MSHAQAPSRAEGAALMKQGLDAMLRSILADQMFHAEVVAAGAFHWRRAFQKEFGIFFDGNRVQADTLADSTFRFCQVQWQQRYPTVDAKTWLNRVRVVSPPTDEEIENAWEIEIASDERSMRQHYEGSARIRKGKDLGSLKTPRAVH